MNSKQDQKVDADIWGRIMNDYHHGLPALYTIRREDGYLSEDHSPEVYFATPDEFFEWEEELLEAVVGPVLDIGAGPGRMALWAQAAGLDVVAVESSPLTVKLARERGVKDVRLSKWEEMDAVLRDDENTFGTAFLMGHNPGLGGSPAGLRKLLKMIRQRVRPGGTLLATSIEFTQTDEADHLGYQEAREKAGQYGGEVVIRMEYEGYVGEYFPWLLIESDLLAVLARETGWFMEGLVVSKESPFGVVLRAI